MRRAFLTLLLLFGAAFAHSELESATPGQNAVVTTPPDAVVLTFGEPLELTFSTFKVYALGADPDETNAQRLNGLAGTLVSDVLSAQGDEAARADAGAGLEGRSAEVRLPLKADLTPGHYAVMWRDRPPIRTPSPGFTAFSTRPATRC